jgi:hypothetical protein
VLQRAAQTGKRRCDQDQVGMARRCADVGRGSQCWREAMTRQIARVLALALQATNLLGIARPQDDRMRIGKSYGESGTPGTCSENGDLLGASSFRSDWQGER